MTLKHVDSLQTKVNEMGKLSNGSGDEIIDEVINLNDVTNNHMDSAFYNDTDFKLIVKPDAIKFPMRCSNLEKHKEFIHFNSDVTDIDKNIEIEENIFKVECIYTNKTFKDSKHDNSYVDKPNDTQERDLQQLIIMTQKENVETHEEVKLDDKTAFQAVKIPDIQDTNIRSTNDDKIKNILSGTPPKIEIHDKEKVLMKKFVNKWKRYVCHRKKYVVEQRQAILNNFFDKITRKKNNLKQSKEFDNKAKHLVRDYNTYQHRYKVQKHIIALQKAKLAEQNRLIEELKYNKIIEVSRHSIDTMREEVRKTYYQLDRQLNPKIKCLTNELKLHNIQDQSLVLHCLKVPQFLQRMEKRAREREEKHAIIRERRKQMEEERIRLKQQAELAKAEMDKEEKIKRIKELKEKRKREKIENIRRKQYVERMRALTVMADLHYEKTLMAKYGIRPLRILIEIKRDNIVKAKAHYHYQLKKNVLLHWMWYTEDMWFERNYKAEDFYRKKLLLKVFAGFKMYHQDYTLKRQVAEDYYDLYVTQLVFRRLRVGVELLKKDHQARWQKAVVYHTSNLLFKTFTCWRTLPALNALKREQETRKARWRKKVLQVVPDYSPPED